MYTSRLWWLKSGANGIGQVCAVKSADGSAIYEAVSQSDGCGGDPSAMMSLMTLAGQRVRDSLTYIPGEKYDERVPEPAYRLMLSSSAKGATIVTANGQQVGHLFSTSAVVEARFPVDVSWATIQSQAVKIESSLKIQRHPSLYHFQWIRLKTLINIKLGENSACITVS